MSPRCNLPTAVWWDINHCPVPDGYDARSVGVRIEETLKKAGYSGPVTVTAIGNLKHTLKQSPHVLRDLYCGGIHLKHVLRGFVLDCLSIIFEDMLDWKRKNPPPAAIMLISGWDKDLWSHLGLLQNLGYTILRAFPTQKSPLVTSHCPWACDWEALLGSRESSLVCACFQHLESGWVCTLCQPYGKSFDGRKFEDFTTHLKSRDHALCEIYRPERIKDSDPDTKTLKTNSIGEEEVPKEDAKVFVWWDINTCPVPSGYDARRVRPSIESALNKSGYSCPLTITAVGNLSLPLRQSPDILPAISSTGIRLQHVLSGFEIHWIELTIWEMENPPPATLMLISSHSAKDLSLVFDPEYTILQAVPLQVSSLPTSNHLWVWESLLKDSESQVLQEKCSESGWDCTLCQLDDLSIEDLTTHLKSRDHALNELNRIKRPLSKKMCKFIDSYGMPVPYGRLQEPSKARGEEEEEEEEGGGEGEGEGEGEGVGEGEDQWESSSLDSMLSKRLLKRKVDWGRKSRLVEDVN